MPFPPGAADQQYCYLTTTGRRSGEPREIEVWFALEGGVLYMLSGGRDKSHWVRNLRKEPAVMVRIDGVALGGHAREVEREAEDALARRLLLEKYAPGYSGSLEDWGRTALPVAVDFDEG